MSDSEKVVATPVAQKFPVVLSIVGVVALGGVFTLGYFLRGMNIGTGTMPTPTVTATPSLQPTDSTNVSISTTPLGTPVVVTPQYTIKVGKNSSVTLPQGWYVSKVFGTFKTLTEDELKTIVKESYMLDATIPIHKDAGFEFTNGSSTISLSSGALYVLGAVGFVPDKMPANWTIVQKPTSDKSDGAGFARYQEGGVYVYEDIFICDPAMCDGGYGQVSTPFGVKMTFSGASADITVADQFYKNNVLNKEVTFGN